jgi:hypothetical protein
MSVQINTNIEATATEPQKENKGPTGGSVLLRVERPNIFSHLSRARMVCEVPRYPMIIWQVHATQIPDRPLICLPMIMGNFL